MSDLKRWIDIVEQMQPSVVNATPDQSEFKLNDTVVINPMRGGGIGRFVHDIGDLVIIDVKGNLVEFNKADITKLPTAGKDPFDSPNDKFHINVMKDMAELLRDKPDPQTGDLVRVENVYGTSIGPGYGTFMSYSTTGEEAIVNFDGQVISVPVEQISSAVEQESENEFEKTGNDGAMSPMSLGSDNIQPIIMTSGDDSMSHNDEFSQWISTVEKGIHGQLGAPEPVDQCTCRDWDCPECYPDDTNAISEPIVVVDDLVEDEFDDSEPHGSQSQNDTIVSDAPDDVAELIGKIQYMQDMGLSASDRHYDASQLMNISNPAVIQRIYDKVMGNVLESIDISKHIAEAISEGKDANAVHKLARRLYSGDLSYEEWEAEMQGLLGGTPSSVKEPSAAEFFGYANPEHNIEFGEDAELIDKEVPLMDTMSSIEKKIAIAKAAHSKKDQPVDEEEVGTPKDHGLSSLGNKIVNAKLKHAGKDSTQDALSEDDVEMGKAESQPDEEVMEWIKRFADRDRLVKENASPAINTTATKPTQSDTSDWYERFKSLDK